MALKYRFNLKDINLKDFKVYLFALFKGVLPKKKIKNLDDLKDYIQKKISMGFSSHIIWIFKNSNGNQICLTF